MTPRNEALARIKREVVALYPTAVVQTNDDTNPATPMAITAQWGTQLKAIRAESIATDQEAFRLRVLAELAGFHKARVTKSAA